MQGRADVIGGGPDIQSGWSRETKEDEVTEASGGGGDGGSLGFILRVRQAQSCRRVRVGDGCDEFTGAVGAQTLGGASRAREDGSRGQGGTRGHGRRFKRPLYMAGDETRGLKEKAQVFG